jgi:hypothetical protein
MPFMEMGSLGASARSLSREGDSSGAAPQDEKRTLRRKEDSLPTAAVSVPEAPKRAEKAPAALTHASASQRILIKRIVADLIEARSEKPIASPGAIGEASAELASPIGNEGLAGPLGGGAAPRI